MKELFKSWREFYKTPESKNKLSEGWTAWDDRAERDMRRREREAAAAKQAAEHEASPEGNKKAKQKAVYTELSRFAQTLKKSEWDRDYLERLPNMIAYKFSLRTDLPSPADPGFSDVLNKLITVAEPELRAEYEKWDSEGRAQYKADETGAWWHSEGHQQYVVSPADKIVSQI